MNENENVGFEDFENALFGDDYQFGDEDGAYEADDTNDAENDANDNSVDSDDIDDDAEDVSEGEEEPDEAETAADDTDDEAATNEPEKGTEDEQTFTLKVNKEERKVTLEEMTALAQKGADYDRVKENYAKSQQTIQDMQAKLDEHQSTLDILKSVAEKSGTTLEELAESIYINVRKSAGASEDAAREELKSAKLEKELNSYKESQKKQPEDDADSRAKREMEEFQKEYPDVQLTSELIKNLTADIQNGMSLSAAYRKLERSQANAKIAELEAKLAAKAQNDKNKSRSPGSQKDSGGRRTRSDYDDFERALFG